MNNIKMLGLHRIDIFEGTDVNKTRELTFLKELMLIKQEKQIIAIFVTFGIF